jgi:hypothetical protein
LLITKTIFHAITILGLLLSLFELLGFFKDKDKVFFYETLKKDLEVKLDHPGTKKFIKDFVLNNSDYRNVDLSEIEKITVRALGIGPANDDRKNATQMIAGSVVLKRMDGKVSKNLCTIDELRAWSEQSLFWRWFAWIILATGVVLDTIVFIFENFFKK